MYAHSLFWARPQGMLLVGFSEADGAAVEGWMLQMEPSLIVSYCTAGLLNATLEDAVSSGVSGKFRRECYERVDEVLPRLVLLSGMTGEESVAIAEHWELFTGGAQTPAAHSRPQLLLTCSLLHCSSNTSHDVLCMCCVCRHTAANPCHDCTEAMAPASARGSACDREVLCQQVACHDPHWSTLSSLSFTL